MFENIFDILNVPLGFIIRVSYALTNNYAIALLLFAIVIKVLLFPLGWKQQKNMVKQASLRPKEQAIRSKYAGRDDNVTKQKMQEEIMALYQKENFNPMGGCLPMLIQMPILFSLYHVVTNPLKYLCLQSAEVITNITTRAGEIVQLAEKQVLSQIQVVEIMKQNFASFGDINGMTIASAAELPNFNVFGTGFDLSQVPNLSEPGWLLLVPVLTFVFSYGSMILNRKLMYQPQQDAQSNASMKIMDFTMPLMSVWISFSVPAVLGVYWIFQNILGVVQQFILTKILPYPTFTEEDYKAAEREYGGKPSKKKKGSGMTATSGDKKLVRSLHRIDDEEYMAAYEAQQAEEKAEKEARKAAKNGGGNELIGQVPLKDEDDKSSEGKDNK
ncbi:MAG: membrane protein insertase YidC [Clostridia bacterium]|nr:membrane protein insertase YidC [Clostridia bacterium]